MVLLREMDHKWISSSGKENMKIESDCVVVVIEELVEEIVLLVEEITYVYEYIYVTRCRNWVDKQ